MALVVSDICFPLLGNGLGVHSVETIRLDMRDNRYGVSNNDSHLPFPLKSPDISRGYLVLSSDNKAILLCSCGAWAMRIDSFKNRCAISSIFANSRCHPCRTLRDRRLFVDLSCLFYSWQMDAWTDEFTFGWKMISINGI